MTTKTIWISINTTWNIVNFRLGLVRALQAEGYRIGVLAPSDGYEETLKKTGVEYHNLPMDAKGISPFKDFVLFVRYVLLLRRYRPDCFLGYTVKPNVYGSLAAHLLGIPVINNIAGLGMTFNKRNWLNTLVRWLYRAALRKSKTVFFQNEEDRNLFVTDGLVVERRAQRLPGSGVDLKHFSPAAKRRPSDHFTFLLVTRLLWSKGVKEFFEAAKLLRGSPSCPRFQIAGIVDEAHPDGVAQHEIAKWSHGDIIEYLGALDDVRPALAGADCVVLPTFYPEGTPKALLEAAAMGKSLIATDTPGCRSVIDDGVNGYLCLPCDVPSLVDAMQRMLALEPDVHSAFGAASRRKAEEEFDERIVISRYLKALEGVWEQPPAY